MLCIGCYCHFGYCSSIKGNVAHDLRTPLQAFASELEVLRHNLSGQQLQLQPESQYASQISSIKQLDRLCHFMNMTLIGALTLPKSQPVSS
jgi:K+-sensing histidine kinase KdpD